ncbi:hypothetical protein TanjilG_24792 [Lupinus angustifolius]|uniref:BHLH domain-containing protein n=1 Tax=Lupinus angustifolius TaxID=3871 RepID=A0A4P1RLB2_LUPAN|nr:hypothetical protein TanjilG_24792 [Lupinus angustifolius]
MEPVEEWSSLSGLYTADEADFMSQLLDNYSVPGQIYENFNMEIPCASLHGHESTIVNVTGINKSSHFSENAANANVLHNSNILPSISGSSCYLNDPLSNTRYVPIGTSFVDDKLSPYSYQENENQYINENIEDLGVADKSLQAHKDCEEALVSEPAEEDITCNLENSRIRSRRSVEAHKNKRNVKPRKKQKTSSASNTEEDTNAGIQWLSLSNCCSEDDSNASQEINGEGSSSLSLSPKDLKHVKINGKSRCSRGSATDPQSIYARVDISTMLEEAVVYVKFLQLQIKLLSSDDLWMYAPIAYNGMNIGLDLNLTPTKQP